MISCSLVPRIHLIKTLLHNRLRIGLVSGQCSSIQAYVIVVSSRVCPIETFFTRVPGLSSSFTVGLDFLNGWDIKRPIRLKLSVVKNRIYENSKDIYKNVTLNYGEILNNMLDIFKSLM